MIKLTNFGNKVYNYHITKVLIKNERYKFMKKSGFTLAEVLLVLVIIGVVASLTIPTLMNNTGGSEYKAALKKAIATTGNALTMHYALEGLTAQDYTSGEELVNNLFKKRLSVMDTSNSFTDSSACTGSTFTTTDGMIFCVTNFASTSKTESGGSGTEDICDSFSKNPCAQSTTMPNLWIDVNGAKKPNKRTISSSSPRDIYQAMIYAQKVVPYGTATQGVMFDNGNTIESSTKTP